MSFGVVQSAISSIKSNRGLLSKRVRLKNNLGLVDEKNKIEYVFPKTTPKKLNEIRRNIIQENKIRSIKRLTVLGIVVTILLSVVVYFI